MSRQPRRYAVCAAWALSWSLTAAAADEHKEKIEPPIKPAVAIPGIERAPAKHAAIANVAAASASRRSTSATA